AQVKASQQAIERRNNMANAKIQSIEAQDARLTEQFRQQQQRDKAINDKYNKLNEQNLKDYQAFMNELKQVPAEKTARPNDAFWNETAQVADYMPFYDSKNREYGFKDKTGRIRLSPQYSKAIGFGGGVAYVEFNYQEKKAPVIINTKGEELFRFSPAAYRQYSKQTNIELQHGTAINISPGGGLT